MNEISLLCLKKKEERNLLLLKAVGKESYHEASQAPYICH